MLKVRVDVDTNLLDRVARDLPNAAEAVVRKVALDLEAEAKRRAPVDTGTLRQSITAERLGPGRWRVVVMADYGTWVEYGTRHNRAQPYLTPAALAVQDNLNAGLARALEGRRA